MKLLLKLGCCFLIFSPLFAVAAASKPAKPFTEDAPYVSRRNEYALRGKKIELSCTIHSGNAPKSPVSWSRNGENIRAGDRVAVGIKSLAIEHVALEDNGVYTCHTSTDGILVERCSINLKVLSAPYFTAKSDVVYAVETKPVELKFKVNGGPKPAVQWLRGERELTGERYEITDTGDLRIQNVSTSDQGTYTCHANNEYGSVNASVYLFVVTQTRITEAPEDRELVAGETATFSCQAEAYQRLSLRIGWSRNGQPIDVESEPRVIQHSENSLTIVKVNKLDSGAYTCVASTDLDEARAQATLAVHGEPDPPTILEVVCGSNDARVSWASVNDTRSPILRYSVVYNSSLAPDIWRVASDRVPAANSSYFIERLLPWANYSVGVIAWNEHGPSESSSRSSGCTTLSDVPYKNPEDVEVESDEIYSLVVGWTVMPPLEHNGPKFAYRVHYKPDITEEEWTVEDVDDWRTNDLRIESQPNYQRYKIKVVAVNEKGECREPPREVTGHSAEGRPSRAPGNFTVKEIQSSTTAVLSWTRPREEVLRGVLHHYFIDYWSDKGAEHRHKSIPLDVTEAFIDKLVPGTKNYAKIRVYNKRFRSPFSEVISFEMPEKPETL